MTEREDNGNMRTHTSVDGVLNGHREHHHHNLFAQHLGGSSCGHDPSGSLLRERSRGSRFIRVFEDWDEYRDRDPSTYVLVAPDLNSLFFVCCACFCLLCFCCSPIHIFEFRRTDVIPVFP